MSTNTVKPIPLSYNHSFERKKPVWITKPSFRNFLNEYNIINQIGEPGMSATAYKCQRKSDKLFFAVKQIDKSKIYRFDPSDPLRVAFIRSLKSEVKIMKKLKHRSIIQLIDIYENKNSLYIVMELCNGGELFDMINKKGRFEENECKQIIKQVLEGTFYFHEQHSVIHRDLKPDNILFTNDNTIKIIDFGMSEIIPRLRACKKLCGSPYYTAPEVIKGDYNNSCDIWSVGVITFVMLFGFPPFYVDDNKYTGNKETQEIYKRILNGFTGIGCGYRTHPNHRRKGLFVELGKWQNYLISILYPTIKRIRATAYRSNIASIKVQAKSQGLIPIKRDNFLKILYGHIVYSAPDDYYKSVLTPTEFLFRLNDVIQQNQVTFEVIYDVDYIIDILKHKYNKNELFVDWKIFDLLIGINDARRYLLEEIKSKRLKIVSNPNRSCLGMIYIDERPNFIQLHIYGVTNDHLAVISLMDKLFKQYIWKKEEDGFTCYWMIDEALNNNAKMNSLCTAFDSIVITEKYL